MPPKRKLRGARVQYGSGHIFQLCHGHDFFGDGFGTDLDAMRAAWPELREAVYEMVQERSGDDSVPWGEFMFGRRGGSVAKRQNAWKQYQQERADRALAEAPRLV